MDVDSLSGTATEGEDGGKPVEALSRKSLSSRGGRKRNELWLERVLIFEDTTRPNNRLEAWFLCMYSSKRHMYIDTLYNSCGASR